ncbi:cytochrome c oxidase accessory protein CcoG [Pseudohalioglobus lutimaris]|uniref:Cytochrome c oxidase accessory protein CcoG n=1 Tax=Pseudohalioglobus lutimaris TaxID=1737061 RepID=A0A2N5X0V4_9GAMM|nr:cytochrome c oxidase accessory protein CcoG [Pseudohalioglobus lutimaris]PLW68111.1 cytochrome c oxidase accessory protein CcoG [Pseudohalioglobus lutimaris]
MSETNKDLIDLQEVAPAEVAEVDLYQKRERIYTRKVEGFFQKVRLYTGWPLLLGYFLLPWLSWNGQQVVLFDLPARKFHILGLTFWPQDFPMLAFLLIIAAYSLFAITTFAGRIWCGYTCPQTVWTTMFMWVEQKTEGSRNQRIKLDKAPMSTAKFTRKFMKHAGWLFIAFMTGLSFVGYFYGMQDLVRDIATLQIAGWGLFWTLFFTVTTYINAGYMREQVCKYMCPYARFQSVMFDQDTLIVSYDKLRGDPRGSRKKTADPGQLGLGDCIDCELCVQVCPTGIDIRDGLQYECIGCALCVDACNSVMDKMGYDPGLVRYTSENELAGGTTHWLRPRIIGYVVVLAVMVGVFSYNMFSRIPLELTIIRDRNQLYVTTDTGAIDNIYTLQLVNMDPQSHVFDISIEGLDQGEVIGETRHELNGGEVRSINLRVRVAPEDLQKPSTEFDFRAQATDRESLQIIHESRFIKPL